MATVGEPFLSPIPTGWKCSVCGKVNEPWVQQCPCEWRTIHVPDVSACDASARDNADARHDADDRLLDERNTMSNTLVTILAILKGYGPLLVGAMLTGIGASVQAGWKEPVWLIGVTAALSVISGVASLAHPAMAAKLAAKGQP